MIFEYVQMNSVCRPKQWKTISSSNLKASGYPVYGANGKIGFNDSYTHENPTLMITCRGATCGTVNISEPKSYINGNAMALDSLDEARVHIKFLYYFFKQRGFRDVITGSAQPQITRQGLQKVKLPLPPLPIQKQIAAVLEKADNLRQQSQQMEQELNSLAQSVFFDMFGDSLKNEKKWVSKTVLDVSRKVTDGTHQTPEWSDSGIPFLFISNIRDGEVNFDTKKFITLECFKELTKTTPIEPDDILYTTVGSYGHVALVKSSFPEFCFQRHIAHIKPDPEKILPEFLYYQLQSQGCKHQADNLVRGIAQKTLNLKDLKSIRIIIPPIELQKEYVLKVSVLSRFKHLNKVEGLDLKLFFNSLMQRAFKGELDLKDVA